MPGPRRLADANAVVAATDRDPYVRNTARDGLTHGWRGAAGAARGAVHAARRHRVRVEELTAADEGRVTDLLDAVPGLRSAAPGDAKVRRWVGVRDGGRLVACTADTSAAPAVGHMGSVAVHPSARRRGLASAVVGWLTADLLRRGGAEVVVVGVFLAEKPAMRLYERVGYERRHEFLSGELTVYTKSDTEMTQGAE